MLDRCDVDVVDEDHLTSAIAFLCTYQIKATAVVEKLH